MEGKQGHTFVFVVKISSVFGLLSSPARACLPLPFAEPRARGSPERSWAASTHVRTKCTITIFLSLDLLFFFSKISVPAAAVLFWLFLIKIPLIISFAVRTVFLKYFLHLSLAAKYK